jgi:hypothetical protein
LNVPAIAISALLLCAAFPAAPARAEVVSDPLLPLEVRIAADQADAAIAILAKRTRGAPVVDRDWTRLFATDGYRRLREREASMGRAFDDADMRAFLMSDSMKARASELATTVASWKKVQMLAAARRAFVYLPPGTPIRATVYLVIKPRGNSFVFDLHGHPAIFLSVDPDVPPARLANTIAHELHHVGLASVCPEPSDSWAAAAAREMRRWMGAFGEGVAVLAASGGPLVHPDLTWSAADQAEWKRDMRDTRYDMTRLERFFESIADGSLSDPDSMAALGRTFYGNRGAWYTVGYQMSNAVERAFGRARLVATLCDMRELAIAYQAAVPVIAAQYGAELPQWSVRMMSAIRGTAAPRGH